MLGHAPPEIIEVRIRTTHCLIAAGVQTRQASNLVNLHSTAQLTFAVLAAVGVFSFVKTAKDAELRRQCLPLCQIAPRYANANRRVPDFTLKRLDGRTARISDWRGRAVVLNFWSVTCVECKKELPSLAQIAQTLRARGDAEVITITPDESVDDVKNMLAATVGNNPPFEVLLDPGSRIIADRFGTKLYPETWFIDKEGVIRARIDGARDYSQPVYLEFVKSLLERNTCEIQFSLGQPKGGHTWLCDEASG